MASSAYEQILKVQALDVSIRQLRHRHANHETRAVVEQIEADLSETDSEIAAVDVEIGEAQKQQRALEHDVGSLEDKQQGIQTKLYGGEVTASKELLALQAEADMLAEKQRAIEDDQLVIMESVETLIDRKDDIAKRRAEITGRLDAAVTDRDDALVEIDREIAKNGD